VHAAGARILEQALSKVGSGRRREPLLCCDQAMHSVGRKQKTILTLLGPVVYDRSVYQCTICRTTRCPGDEALDVVNTTRSPGVRRLVARAGSHGAFREGRDDLKVYAGITVSTKDVERGAEEVGKQIEAWQQQERSTLHPAPVQEHDAIPVMYIAYDGTGVPMTHRELAGRKGKQEDGTSKTREAKLGCVFTQTSTDDRGRPVRDPASTSFVGAIEDVHAFGPRIYDEALRRGLAHAQRVVILGDGALWIRGIAQDFFPQALHIVDLYHAREHVADLAKLLANGNTEKNFRSRFRWWALLDRGLVEQILQEARLCIPSDPTLLEKITKEINYLNENRDRMRYKYFRSLGLFVGSGVIEAGCKSLVGLRLKQSGMHWSVRGANAILALRCVSLSARFEDFWESRCAA